MPGITRRQFAQAAGVGAAGMLLAGPSVFSRQFTAKPQERPNLLYVFADQLGINHCGYAGNTKAYTPTIDRLARQGISFTNAVSTMPVCCAHRASLFTGKYPTTTGVVINELRVNPKHRCLGHVLTENDYQTCYIGKWHLWASDDDPRVPTQTDHLSSQNSFTPPGKYRLGFDGYWAAYNYHHVYYDAFYHTQTPEKISYGPGAYEPDAQTDLMIAWLRQAAKTPKPFAAILSYGPPHAPWTRKNVPAAWLEKFENVSLPNPPNYKPEDDEPYTDGWGRISPEQRDRLELSRRIYYAMTASVDASFARLLHALDELGLAQNTIVVFSSDHGEMFGAHGRLAKNIFYEEAARVPFLVRWPGHIPVAATSDACLGTVDIMPTLLGLLDLPIPKEVEGMDLSAHVTGRGGPEPLAAFLQNTGACAAWQDGHEWRALRDKRFTYARYRVDGHELLFDNKTDPYQMNNLMQDKQNADTANRFRTMMAEKMDQLNDTNETCTWYREHWTDGNRAILRGAKG